MAMAKEAYNPSVFDTAAAAFVATNGMSCNLYAMMAYFGGYLTSYKQTAALFDISDILRAFKSKFLSYWTELQAKVQKQNETYSPSSNKPTGKAALWQYLQSEYLDKGLRIQDSDLYQFGYIPDADIPLIETHEPPPF